MNENNDGLFSFTTSNYKKSTTLKAEKDLKLTEDTNKANTPRPSSHLTNSTPKYINGLKILDKQKPADLFSKPVFPLISHLSQKDVLNNSDKMLNQLLDYNSKKPSYMQRYLYRNQSAQCLRNVTKVNQVNLKLEFKQKRTFDNPRVFSEIEKRYKLKKSESIKDHMVIHDCNIFNHKFLFKEPMDNYAYNAYRAYNMMRNNQFIDNIKADLMHQTYNCKLRAFLNINN